MKRFLSLAALFAFALTLIIANTQDSYAQGKPANKGFVDANGDGYNDNAADDDGDGIPNGQDEDFEQGTGMGNQGARGLRGGRGTGTGTGEGTGTGTGECDETGPKGNGRRGK